MIKGERYRHRDKRYRAKNEVRTIVLVENTRQGQYATFSAPRGLDKRERVSAKMLEQSYKKEDNGRKSNEDHRTR